LEKLANKKLNVILDEYESSHDYSFNSLNINEIKNKGVEIANKYLKHPIKSKERPRFSYFNFQNNSFLLEVKEKPQKINIISKLKV